MKKLNDELLAQKLTAIRTSDRDRDIWVIPSDGKSEPFPLTIDNQWDDVMPNWSPDDQYIAYVSSRTNVKKIWTMNKDGTDKVQLTKGTAADYYPMWSPDGRYIAFIRNENLFIITLSSRAEQQISKNINVERLCAWSRNGKSLLIVIRKGNQQSKLVEFNLTSNLTSSIDLQPSLHTLWNNLRLCPTIDQVAFEVFEYDYYDIAIEDLTNERQWHITQSFSHDRHPAWSSKGDFIAFSSNRRTPNIQDIEW
ncbi:MAG: TolB family protein [bacterium]